jgi:hypothetical protein
MSHDALLLYISATTEAGQMLQMQLRQRTWAESGEDGTLNRNSVAGKDLRMPGASR